MKLYADCTGRLVSALPDDGELLELVRTGIAFKLQHCGKRPEFLTRYLAGIVAVMPHPWTFDALLRELERAAAKREQLGERASPIERVDYGWSCVIYHDPHAGRKYLTFGTLRNKLTQAKKIITASAKP